jgi:hypothetical protein
MAYAKIKMLNVGFGGDSILNDLENDGTAGMSLVDQKYNEALDKMSGKEKVERTASLFCSICEMLTLQVTKEFPHLPEREVRIRVSERLYMADEGVQQLLRKARAI